MKVCAGAFYKEHPGLEGTSSDEQAISEEASAVVETRIPALAGTINLLDVMVFWYSSLYRYPQYRTFIKNVAAHIQAAAGECPKTIDEDQGHQATLLALALCIQDKTPHKLPAMLMLAGDEHGFDNQRGVLIVEKAKVRAYTWKLIALPYFP